MQANDLTSGEEQLMAEVEELQSQVLEFQEGKDQDKRAIQGWEWLARL